MSTQTTAPQTVDPAFIVKVTVDALIGVFETMQGITLKPNGPISKFDSQDLEYGSCISLIRPNGGWNLGLLGTNESCKSLARALLGMEPEEDLGKEELADALGEIVNMVAGVVKRKLPAGESQELHLGLPLFIAGTDCFRYVAKGKL
jgi:CheY-specific phosphatase CheX